jgi:hypothetical protein
MKYLLSLVLALSVLGCSAPDVSRYRTERPLFDPRVYLNGTLDAWGMFQDRSGAVIKRFHVVMDASWKDDTCVLDEHFSWSDGTSSRRVWTIKRDADGTLHGRADDVVGEALGEMAGNALHWRYVLALPVDGKVINVDVDDWMFQMDDKVMLNRSAMSKYGVGVGDVTLSFMKR